ncbi:unnamed protein product [Oppiella nova]|nr:unnamed protein product [Oppiella nova]CAG2164247.1 unnamed protein product [Oppiella nova]
MNNLSEHWVFSPFKLLLSNESIDFYVVHLGGFMFDLTIGFFLVWNKSRFFAYFFCLLFNSMNSRIFSIGMFPYMMISVMPVFSAYDWPKQVINLLKSKCLPSIQTVPKKRQNKLKNDKTKKDNEKRKKLSTKEKITLTSIFIYLLTQLFLPHSHWITKGYNTWTNGLYGYSWDMMVHNWKHIHTRVTVVDKSMRKFYLNPQTWTKSMRWSHHSDMVKQYAMCAQKRLIRDFNITEPSIYIDSWISLNGRFAQRVYDPRVNLVTAEWSAFKRPDWVLPILSDLTDWRQTLKQYEDNIYQQNDYNSVIFIADFPGLTLSNYIDSHFPNTSLTVLKGWLKIEMVGTGHMMYTRFMSAGDHLTLPVNTFHRLTPIRAEAAAYMYVYANTSHQMLNDVKTSAHDIQDFAVITDADRSPWIRRYL